MNITLIQKTTLQVIKHIHYAVLILKGLADTHMQKYLLLGITCFVIVGNNISLLADSSHENIVTEKMSNQHDYMSILEKKIHDLIIHGHSINEIMTLLNDNHSHIRKNQELIIKIYKFLNEQNSKNNNGTTILINNKESEEFYAQMNSLTRMKKRILILKIIIATGITAGILYLLYRLLKTNQSASEGVNEEEDDNDTFLDHEDLNVARVENLQNITQEASNERQELGTNSQDTMNDRQKIIDDESHNGSIARPWEASLLREPREIVMQQIEHARNIGLETAAGLPEYRPVTNNPIFTMTITEQLEHAGNTGLISRAIILGNTRLFMIPANRDGVAAWGFENTEFTDRSLGNPF